MKNKVTLILVAVALLGATGLTLAHAHVCDPMWLCH